MTKYKFNEEAAKLGLPFYLYKYGCLEPASQVEVCDDNMIDVMIEKSDEPTLFCCEQEYFCHTTNRIPYDPAKHPITLKIMWCKAERVMPYKCEERCIYFVRENGEKTATSVANLFVEFDLEEVFHE